MARNQVKMSLVTQYDDVVRYVASLEDGLDDVFVKFIMFVDQQEEFRKRYWEMAKNTLPKQRIADEESLNRIQHLNSVIHGLKADLQYEQERNSSLENKVSELNQILSDVKKLVCGEDVPDKRREILEYLSRVPYAQTTRKSRDVSLDGNEILFDKTDDDLDLDENIVKQNRQSGKRPGRIEKDHTPPKRSKSDDEILVDCEQNTSVVATTKVTIPPNHGNVVAESKIETFPPRRSYNLRSRRSSELLDEEPITPSAPPMLPAYNFRHFDTVFKENDINIQMPRRASITAVPSPVQCTPIRQCISTSKLNKRQHHFASKTVIRPETCSPCGRKIKFYKQALKCADCRATCHPECKASVPVPCIPVTHTPTHPSKSSTVADYAPSEPPMVPALIVHCVNELESRGMKETGLYRISGSDKDIKELKAKILKGKGVPCLSKIDVHVICGLIKDFLRSFETLIPRTMWRNFIGVLDIYDAHDCDCALYQAISQLPAANKDTLAFLILHWQRIAEIPEIKMPVKNLASILAPTIVGYSVATLPDSTIREEQNKITAVMEKLLNLNNDFWNRILNPESDSNVFKTPDARPAPEGSILGPVSSTGTWNLRSKTTLGRTPLSPRGGFRVRTLKPGMPFFTSPVLR